MKTIRLALVLSLVALIGQTGAFAAGPAGSNNIRIQLGYMVASGDQTEIIDRLDYSSLETKAKFSGGAGIAFAYEYRLNDLVGLEASIGYFQTKLRAQVWEQAVDKQVGPLVFDHEKTVHTLPISLGVNFHLSNNSPVDFFLGPRLSYMSFGSYSAAINNSKTKDGAGYLDLDLKKEFMIGLTLGLDVPMSGGWGWAFRLDYTPAQVKIDTSNQPVSTARPVAKSIVQGTETFLFAGNKLKPNPITLTIGASYKF